MHLEELERSLARGAGHHVDPRPLEVELEELEELVVVIDRQNPHRAPLARAQARPFIPGTRCQDRKRVRPTKRTARAGVRRRRRSVLRGALQSSGAMNEPPRSARPPEGGTPLLEKHP